jgi:Predicted dithiol-disulfide isomerase involved in polyketide biosynthesis
MQTPHTLLPLSLRQVALLAVLLFVSAIALAQPRPMDEGKHYERIDPPIATDTPPEIIEMLDVFWYGCPVCSEFEPMMSYWGGEVRGDLVLHRMPAIWNPVMKLHAQIYYTAVQLKIDDEAHSAAFRHIHEKHQPLNTVDQARAFFAELGVAADAFEQAWNSPEVAAALAEAEQKTKAAGISRLPTLVVNGRYRVVRNEGVPELPEVVITANQLIKILRDERRTD